MAEQVQTGGVMQFHYSDNQPDLDPERKDAIEQGYAEAGERKRKKKIQTVIFWIILLLFFFGIIIYVSLNN